MTLEEKIRDDLKQAIRGEDKLRCLVLRSVLAEAKNAEIAQQKPLDDAAMVDVVAKGAKQRRESIEAFNRGERQELAAKEEAELAVLLEYLPKQVSREEIVSAARQVIEEVGAGGVKDKGKVMSKLMPQLKGKAEGRQVNEVVMELLGG